MRIGIFGGTFDPLHLGHMQLLQQVSDATDLPEILVIPCGVPPHGKATTFDDQTRMAMVRSTIKTYPGYATRWTTSDVEMTRPRTSYTVDTIRAIRSEFPERRPALILGEEELWTFENWREPRAILEMADIVAVDNGRAIWTFDELPEWIRSGVTDRVATEPPIAISSTIVRRRLQEGLSIRFLVPDVVLEIVDEWLLR